MATAKELAQQVIRVIGQHNYLKLMTLAKKFGVPLIHNEEPSAFLARVRRALDKWVIDNNFGLNEQLNLARGRATVTSGVQWNRSLIPTIAVRFSDQSVTDVRVEDLIVITKQ